MNNNSIVIIDFEPISRRLYYKKNENFYQLLVDSGIRVRSLCGGFGSCGKCKILVQQGHEYLIPPTDSEKNFLSKDEIHGNFRLACQCKIAETQINLIESYPQPQIRVFLPQDTLIEDFKILTSGINKGVNLSPNVKKIFIEVNKPSLENPIPDLERISYSLLSKNEFNENQFKPSFEIET